MCKGCKMCKDYKTKKSSLIEKIFIMVGVTGIEPATSWSQTTRAPICATPRSTLILYL